MVSIPKLKKKRNNRNECENGYIFLLYPRNTLQHQGKILPHGKELEKVFQANEPEKQAGVALLRSNKIKFKPKIIKRDMNDMTCSSKEKFTMMF